MVVFSQQGTVAAQLVNADGSITEDPLEFSFSSTINSQPSVAYNPDDGSFSIAFISMTIWNKCLQHLRIETYSVYVYKVSDVYLEMVDSQTDELQSPSLSIAEDRISIGCLASGKQ